MKKITVIGSTGMIGTPVTTELLKAGFEITALVRDVEKAKKLFPNGVDFEKGDLQDKNAIQRSLEGAEGLYINISTTDKDKENEFNPEMGGLDNILDVVKQSSVKRVVYLSSFLARNYKGSWWVMNAKKAGIEKVKSSGIPFTIFYPSNFMENFKNGMVRGNKFMLAGKHQHKAWWISATDFGSQVAKAFSLSEAANKVYSIQGLESLNTEEAAKLYIKNYSEKKLSITQMPIGLIKFLGLFMKQMNFLGNLMSVMNNNKEIFEATETWEQLGKPIISIEKFAKIK